MKKLILIPLMFLVGCGEPPKDNLDTISGETVVEIEIYLEDGRVIECIRFEDGAGQSRIGSIDCNWNGPISGER